MRPRLPTRRILLLRPFKPPCSPRPFTSNILLSTSRPQLPFLSTPTAQHITRFISTETTQWIKRDVTKGVKISLVIWVVSGLGMVIAFGVRHEWLDRKYPAPHEWSWLSRMYYRDARSDEKIDSETEKPMVDWAHTGTIYVDLLARLEDPSIDGAGLADIEEGGILVAGVGKTGFDLSNKPEAWRRGYYEVLMGAARAAEYMDGWVRDKTRNLAFPANTVIGPSNPHPWPVRPGQKSAPREEDCEPGFPAPEVFYMRILTSSGFTEKQRVDAAIAYGSYLEYKSAPGSALEMYRWALDIATASAPDIVDRDTFTLHTNAGAPSANILAATTAIATHHARTAQLDKALPILLSILRARRALPTPPERKPSTLATRSSSANEISIKTLVSGVLNTALTPAKYPAPPPDGRAPPARDALERCEEAGVMTYIGEILYASQRSTSAGNGGKEDGLAWTREAVDIAEEEFKSLEGAGSRGFTLGVDGDGEVSGDVRAKTRCLQCLRSGLSNWGVMVAKMAENEREAKREREAKGGAGSWWGGSKEEVVGRWESEEKVVKERIWRLRECLDPRSQTRLVGWGLI